MSFWTAREHRLPHELDAWTGTETDSTLRGEVFLKVNKDDSDGLADGRASAAFTAVCPLIEVHAGAPGVQCS